MAFGSIMHGLADQSWVSDIEPAMGALAAHGQEGQNVVGRFAASETGTWIPNLSAQAARLGDGVQRDTTSPDSISGMVGNEVANRIPGLRQGLPVRYSVYGTPLQQGASLTGVHTWIPGLSGNGTTETTDPAERELDRLSTTDPDHALVTPVQKSIPQLDADGNSIQDENGHVEMRRLTPAEFEEYQHVAGRATVDTVRQEMSTPEWQNMSDADRVQEVRSIQTDMKAAAREALFNK